MKTTLYNIKGEKISEISLPKIFSSTIRPDITQKYYEAEKYIAMQPYAPNLKAGRRHSASGTISHKRHDWKGHYGRGISRAPRKTMWRRGTNFFWIGAEVSGTRGGRKAHSPKPNFPRKINKKEIIIAMNSAIAATAQEKYILNRYTSLNKLPIDLPLILESKLTEIKTKQFLNLLKTILKDTIKLAIKSKKVRAGKGKIRGRKYKSNAGLLLIKSARENIKFKGIEIKDIEDLTIFDFYPLGRLTAYTEYALREINKGGTKK